MGSQKIISQQSNSRFSIPECHPALAGHFPGNPVVPGVVIIDHVMRLFAAQYPQLTIASINNAKFIKPVMPALVVAVAFTIKNNMALFTCHALKDETVLAKGEFSLLAVSESNCV